MPSGDRIDTGQQGIKDVHVQMLAQVYAYTYVSLYTCTKIKIKKRLTGFIIIQ